MPRREGPPRFLPAAVSVAFVLLVAILVYALWGLFTSMEEGLDENAERRARDAAIVEAQREAGGKYIENLRLTMQLTPPAPPKNEAQLDFIITNAGVTNVIKAVARLSFADAEGALQTRDVILVDDSPTSVRPDKPLLAGETRSVSGTLEVGADWNLEDVQYGLSEVRIEAESP